MKRCLQSTEVMTFSVEAEGNACNRNQKFGKRCQEKLFEVELKGIKLEKIAEAL